MTNLEALHIESKCKENNFQCELVLTNSYSNTYCVIINDDSVYSDYEPALRKVIRGNQNETK